MPPPKPATLPLNMTKYYTLTTISQISLVIYGIAVLFMANPVQSSEVSKSVAYANMSGGKRHRKK